MDKRLVAGIAVGSAAIVAALMFTSRYVKGKPVATAPPAPKLPEPKLPNRPHLPDASDIRIE